MLYLEHSVESLARGGPWQLGKIVSGISVWRPLREVETEEYGGSSRRVLYGCVVGMIGSNSSSSIVTSGENFTMMDEFPLLAEFQDMSDPRPRVGTFRAGNNKQFGSSGCINAANSIQVGTFKQLLLTWSRVC